MYWTFEIGLLAYHVTKEATYSGVRVNKGKTTNNVEKPIIGAESLSKVFGRGSGVAKKKA